MTVVSEVNEGAAAGPLASSVLGVCSWSNSWTAVSCLGDRPDGFSATAHWSSTSKEGSPATKAATSCSEALSGKGVVLFKSFATDRTKAAMCEPVSKTTLPSVFLIALLDSLPACS